MPQPRRARAASLLAPAIVPVTVMGLALAGATAVVPAPAAAAAGGTAHSPDGVYLVTLVGRPAAEHPGTRPSPGHRFDRGTKAVADYVAGLRARQDRVLAGVGEPEVLYRYTTALNGFAARLDEDQVKELRGDRRVVLVERSEVRRPAAAPGASALPSAAAVTRTGGPAGAGRGLVIGFVDSGIWPENPSFAGLPQQAPGRSAGLRGFHGSCAPAESWTPEDCNDKVVSARWFVSGFGRDRLASTELLSARDTTGHGSHAASTAAGESNVDVVVDGERFGRGSGMAPAARIAVYKACWTAPDPADDGCSTADTVAAVDRAVADGVDVLSFAVTGSDDPTDTLSRAFLSAASAGVFVAAAAGNGGPRGGSVGNAAPWVTTVGASTQVPYQGVVRLGDGHSYVGAMASDRGTGRVRLVLGRDVPAPGADRTSAARCEVDALDARKVDGRVVVCERGVEPRVDKSTAVARAGGVGMVLVNTRRDTVEADLHAVPTVHLDVADARSVTSYVRRAGAGATAALEPLAGRADVAPMVAPFSARGPLPVSDLLKPDVVAPGVAVVGAVAPPSDSGRLWDTRSGTSVSAPTVAGMAARLRAERPRWSPSRVKSALMTTANRLPGAGPLAAGAGEADTDAFLDPGVVLDSSPAGWRKVLAGTGRERDLNLPSLAVGRLVGRTTVVRRLTNVSGRTETYNVRADGLTGIDVRVRPAAFTLRPGATRAVRITLVATRLAPVHEYARGRITFTGPRHRAVIPVVARATRVAAPTEVGADVSAGRMVVGGRTGNGAPVRPTRVALAAARQVGLTLTPGPFDPAEPEDDDSSLVTTVAVPDHAEAARFEVTGSNAGDDLDLYVYRGDRLVEASDGPGPRATVTLLAPAAGDYTVYVHAAKAGNRAATTGELATWVVDPTDRVRPETVRVRTVQDGDRPGAPFRSTLTWDGLDPTRRWLGVLGYAGSDRRTLIMIG